jgi:hypothetical protein
MQFSGRISIVLLLLHRKGGAEEDFSCCYMNPLLLAKCLTLIRKWMKWLNRSPENMLFVQQSAVVHFYKVRHFVSSFSKTKLYLRARMLFTH